MASVVLALCYSGEEQSCTRPPRLTLAGGRHLARKEGSRYGGVEQVVQRYKSESLPPSDTIVSSDELLPVPFLHAAPPPPRQQQQFADPSSPRLRGTGIAHLSDCKQLTELDVKRLCDKVRLPRALCDSGAASARARGEDTR